MKDNYYRTQRLRCCHGCGSVIPQQSAYLRYKVNGYSYKRNSHRRFRTSKVYSLCLTCAEVLERCPSEVGEPLWLRDTCLSCKLYVGCETAAPYSKVGPGQVNFVGLDLEKVKKELEL